MATTQKTHGLKRGQRVTVYEDPITQQKVEEAGTVVRIHHADEFPTVHEDRELFGVFASVRFDSEEYPYDRWIYVNGGAAR